jgi:hypothetical protein
MEHAMKTLQILGVTSGSGLARTGRPILAASVALGVAGDLLLRAWPWGVNAAIWLAALCFAALVFRRRDARRHGQPPEIYCLCAALAFSLLLVWRASPVLQVLNLMAVFLCLAMVSVHTAAGALRRVGSVELAANLVVSAAQDALGILALLSRHVHWRSAIGAGGSVRLAAIGRGLAIAAVPVLAFAALFASADVFFRDLLRDVAVVDPRQVLSHLGLWLLFSWLAGSYLWSVTLAEREPLPEAPRPGSFRFEFIEAGVVFGLVNALFLAFVGVQFRYLFGGADRVESSSLTYAEYARHGFFELVTVAALAALFILVTHWLLPRAHARLHSFYAAFAGVLIVLVFVVMASAFERMRLYEKTFGLTELRLYVTAFMCWLGIVFVWLALTVLRGRRELFAFGGLAAGFAVLVALNALNPDAFILRRNATVTGGDGERPFDTVYALSLSPDAVPTLVANFNKVSPAERCAVGRELQSRFVEEDEDWRSWSWGRYQARHAVSSSSEIGDACNFGR